MDMYSYHEGEIMIKRGFASLELSFNSSLSGGSGVCVQALPLFDSLYVPEKTTIKIILLVTENHLSGDLQGSTSGL